MGYAFSLEEPHDGVRTPCAFSNDQMQYVRLVMIEAGATAGGGFEAALPRPGLEPCADTVPIARFRSNGGWHVTAREAAFVATRLRRAVELDVVDDLLMFLDDSPDGALVQEWVEEFAAFNEHAAERDGYYVA